MSKIFLRRGFFVSSSSRLHHRCHCRCHCRCHAIAAIAVTPPSLSCRHRCHAAIAANNVHRSSHCRRTSIHGHAIQLCHATQYLAIRRCHLGDHGLLPTLACRHRVDVPTSPPSLPCYSHGGRHRGGVGVPPAALSLIQAILGAPGIGVCARDWSGDVVG
jgi:hypothetical protein